jgi:hypothetical protein
VWRLAGDLASLPTIEKPQCLCHFFVAAVEYGRDPSIGCWAADNPGLGGTRCVRQLAAFVGGQTYEARAAVNGTLDILDGIDSVVGVNFLGATEDRADNQGKASIDYPELVYSGLVYFAFRNCSPLNRVPSSVGPPT